MPVTRLQQTFALFFLALLLLALGSCHRATPREAGPPPKPDRAWSEVIAGHSAGLISRHSSITVRFARDIAELAQVGTDAARVIEIEPDIDGKLSYTSTREIVLEPSRPLKAGQSYRVRVRAKGLKGVPAELRPYEFDLSVIVPNFELKTAGLESAAGSADTMNLRGELETSDGEEPAAVEKLLSASYRGELQRLEWAHFNENRTHHFTLTGIRRQDKADTLRLAWTGEPIGIKSEGKRDIEVPALGTFMVIEARIARDGRQSIELRFSDPLDARQNLEGLVTLSRARLTTSVQGNVLTIYPANAMSGKAQLKVDEALRSASGARLPKAYETELNFVSEKPQVRFVGTGVVLPHSEALTIPIEAMNAHSLQVTAFQVFDSDIGQFLQTNKLGGENQLHRVGRYLWRKTIRLPSPESDRWTRYALDATELLRAHPGSLFRLTLSINRGNSAYSCTADEQAVAVASEEPYKNNEDLWEQQSSGWDGIEEYYDNPEGNDWAQRDDPCRDAYYRWDGNTRASRNFLASDMGLLAKRGSSGALHVVATSLRDSNPLPGVAVEVRNFQNQVITTGTTDPSGFAAIDLAATPFYLIARKGREVGYLKLSRGVALPVSHFDTGGETLDAGIKGFIYAERGVWRPGDAMYFTFVLEDKTDRIPDGHPVTMQLFNPKGQLAQTSTNAKPVDDFYSFTLGTPEDAPTGTWTVKALIGGAEFAKRVKVETVMPNRLKLELKFPGESIAMDEQPVTANLFAQWLHGAKAAKLKADVTVQLAATPTRFSRFADFIFDDPTRRFSGEPATLWEGRLDEDGKAEFAASIAPQSDSAGLLEANLSSRVFEEGGAFSISQSSLPFHRYARYVGLKLPKGDATREMLLTDIEHVVDIATVNTKGAPVSVEALEVSLYKVEWKWWWEKTPEDQGDFSQSVYNHKLDSGTVATKDGRGRWKFQVKYPEWGRYLIRACDSSGHCSGQFVYIDWPGWAGRAQEQNGPGANALPFTSDKPRYAVGETAVIQLPDAAQGRALLTLETGTRVLEQRWLELAKDKTKVSIPITRAMSPNVYVALTLIQPHEGKENDRPIRLYGVIPLEVSDPQTVLAPQIEADKVWRPEGPVKVQVSEKAGREMTYTVAVVDEGLLGLTGFKTPDPHAQFYKREALGVSTWDLYDEVAGAYGGELERLLALGGDETLKPSQEKKEQKRFPPVVRVLGPFHLRSGETAEHAIDLPQYIGAVRVMVVAGYRGAYGRAEREVIVRQPLSILPTLPRVLGPGETIQVPVSVFAFEPGIRDVAVKIAADKFFELQGPDLVTLKFKEPGEQLASFTLKVKSQAGTGKVTLRAESGPHRTQASISIPVRPQNPIVQRIERRELLANDEWGFLVQPFGVANTNTVTLEVTTVPSFDLERRLQYLVHYPYGCVEQLTSAAFPQIYLDRLLKLDETRRKEIERNVHAAIDRLRGYQMGNGGFAYWPGNAEVNDWANNYAGHFLAEARKLGYHVPDGTFDAWVEFQRETASRWTGSGAEATATQAYRLYTLALADRPEVGAMNRLRETRELGRVARAMLAAAYGTVGMMEPARDLAQGLADEPARYEKPGTWFASDTRDRAILIDALLRAGQRARAEPIVEALASELRSAQWHSTQSTAYALMAFAHYAGTDKPGAGALSYAIAEAKPVAVQTSATVTSLALPTLAHAGGRMRIRNTGETRLFVSLLSAGSPAPGDEAAQADGLALELRYSRSDGRALDLARLAQGTDFVAEVKVTNRTNLDLRDLALTQIFAAGWEIHNPRLVAGDAAPPAADYQDVRDDRVNTFFGLKPGESRTFKVLLNASYLGRYYLPATSVESMYDARKFARSAGAWVEVVKP